MSRFKELCSGIVGYLRGDMDFILESGHLTDRGFVRQENEDSFFDYSSDEIGVFCVADGMGGHTDGKRASSIVVDEVRDWTRGYYKEKYRDFSEILDDFGKCLSASNHKIFQYYNQAQICGTTCVSLIIYEDYYAAFSVGDSRIYRRRGLSVTQLTHDDNWQNSGRIPDNIPEEYMRQHRDFDKLVAAMGIEESVVPHRLTDHVKKGDTFLLCSDGVYRYCSEAVLKKAMGRGGLFKRASLEDSLKTIYTAVSGNGAPDNLTAILIRVR